MKHEFINIAKIISNENEQVITELEYCIKDTEEYFTEHREEFEERGIDEFEDEEEYMIQWLALVDILEKNGYACECDWSEGKEDFLYHLGSLKAILENDLKVQDGWINEDADIVAWCTTIDQKWAEKKCCIAALDIDSDSYVLFVCPVDKMDQLATYAEKQDCRIDLACRM